MWSLQDPVVCRAAGTATSKLWCLQEPAVCRTAGRKLRLFQDLVVSCGLNIIQK